MGARRDDAFLLGDSLLVAPVLTEGGTLRRVVLPPGNWYGYWDDQVYAGEVETEAPPGQPPLFVSAGSVVPRAEGEDLVLQVFAGTGPGGQLYSDGGEGYGHSRADSFELESRDGRLVLNWSGEGT